MKFKPHDHRMWAVMGIYGGGEHNTFYRRAKQGLEQHGTKELMPKIRRHSAQRLFMP